MIYPVILAGGSGTRLWPVSDRQTPKQFLRLFGENSLFQDTLVRLAGFGDARNLRTSCNHEHRARIESELHGLGLPVENHVIGEPVARSTGPAIYMAARLLQEQDPDALLVVLPADHHIGQVAAFQHTLNQAVAAAREGAIVTLGVQPTSPETGYGYIEAADGGECTKVARFVEKPNQARALEFLAAGNFLWNSGMFVFQAAVMIAEFQRLQPELVAAVDAYLAGDADGYAHAPKISVDYAIMEHTDRAAVVRARFDWSDVGTWSAVYQQSDRDDQGNVLVGDVHQEGCRNSLIRANHRRVAALGLEDLIVVEASGAVLVCHKDRTQDVGRISELEPNREAWGYSEHRPWGSFTILGSAPDFKTKRLVVLPGKRLSLQSHKYRQEYWIVVAGRARVTLEDQQHDLQTGDSIVVPRGWRHRVENPGTTPLTLIEVQLGTYFGEDDIVRYQDDFNRPLG